MAVKTAVISIRVPPDLKARMEELARADGRSLAQYVERTLTEHGERMDKLGKLPRLRHLKRGARS